MLRFVLRRLAALMITVVFVSVVAFLIPFLSGGDPATAIMRSRVGGFTADPATTAALRKSLGLDKPVIFQYFAWLRHAATGDFGYSFTSQEPVSHLVVSALEVSVSLALVALIVAFVVAVPLGTLAAMRPGKAFDNAVTFVTQAFVATPEYALAPVLILVFALRLGWLPSAGWTGAQSIVLPAATLALRPMAMFTGVTRASMIDVLAAPYITAARARGLGSVRTLRSHGLRNGMLPGMTLCSLWLAGLLGGSVVVEVIFAVPGMGRLLYTAVVNNDLPVIQGGIVCLVALTVLITTVTDTVYALWNPATRVSHVRL